MELPTKKVILNTTGDEVTINVSDFNQNLHSEIPEVAEVESSEPEVETLQESPVIVHITSLGVSDAKRLIASVTNLEDLELFKNDELAHPTYSGGRQSILSSIEKRRVELEHVE